MHREPDGPLDLLSFQPGLTAAVIGATGGIGAALASHLDASPAVSQVLLLSRSGGADTIRLDLEREETIAAAAGAVFSRSEALDLVIVATGVLHDGTDLQPEKTWRTLSGAAMEQAFRINTIGPSLVAKHFLPLLARKRKAVFAALSARVGSIEDNQLGGWYAYRASKAALNMTIKTLSIELARRSPLAVVVGLHPGTVDSALSRPFQSGVPKRQLFSPDRSARALLGVIDDLEPSDSGQVFAWDGRRIAP
ncbi:MAG: SDR family oxidoreductase [Rhodospirillales bacterium]